jgi:membrane protease YdiL (CAAX protease family)
VRLARAEIAARHPVLVFVALALGWSWSSLLAGRALGGSAGDALQIAAQVGPSLAGLAAAFLCGGRAQLRGLASQALRWRVEPYWYAVALFGPVLLWWVAFAYIAAVQPYSPVSTGEFLAFFPLFALQLALGGGLGEELGWRGFLQSALERGRGVVTASLAVAAVWALWGAPAFLLEGERNAGVGAFLWFAGLCAAYSLIFARVLHGARGSVWIVALLHASANVAEPTWRGVVPSLGGSQAVALVHAAYVLFLALVAVFLRFGPEPRPESA